MRFELSNGKTGPGSSTCVWNTIAFWSVPVEARLIFLMKAEDSSERSVHIYHNTRRHIPEGGLILYDLDTWL